VQETDKLSDDVAAPCIPHMEIQIWRAWQHGRCCHCGVGHQLGTVSVLVFQYFEHQCGQQCAQKIRRDFVKKSVVTLDGRGCQNSLQILWFLQKIQ
jgi:hypothetical protein